MLGSPAFRAARRCHSSRRWRSDGGVAVPPASSLLLPSARVSFFHPLLLFLRVVWSRSLLAWLGSRERVPACVAAVIVPVPAVGLNPPSEPSSFVASSDVGVLLPVIPFPALNLVSFFFPSLSGSVCQALLVLGGFRGAVSGSGVLRR